MSRTLQYLQADMHRAMASGFESMDVQIADLKELLARVEAADARQAIEFSGKQLGFATAHKVRKMREGKANFIHISRHKNEHFDTEVFFTKLPKPAEVAGE